MTVIVVSVSSLIKGVIHKIFHGKFGNFDPPPGHVIVVQPPPPYSLVTLNDSVAQFFIFLAKNKTKFKVLEIGIFIVSTKVAMTRQK